MFFYKKLLFSICKYTNNGGMDSVYKLNRTVGGSIKSGVWYGLLSHCMSVMRAATPTTALFGLTGGNK